MADDQGTFMFGEFDDTVNIPMEEYEDLMDDSMMLEALSRAGVDNWDGYEYALEIYQEMNSIAENDNA